MSQGFLLNAYIDVYLVVLGLVLMSLEVKSTVVTAPFAKLVAVWMKGFTTIKGRASLQFFTGSLAVCQWDAASEFFVVMMGFVLLGLSVLNLLLNAVAKYKMGSIKSQLGTKEE